jgi:hypothetical protein
MVLLCVSGDPVNVAVASHREDMRSDDGGGWIVGGDEEGADVQSKKVLNVCADRISLEVQPQASAQIPDFFHQRPLTTGARWVIAVPIFQGGKPTKGITLLSSRV